MQDISKYMDSVKKRLERPAPHDPIREGLERVANSLHVPLKWVDDFTAYQNKRGWKINGQPIVNPYSVFKAWANTRRAKRAKNALPLDYDLLNVP